MNAADRFLEDPENRDLVRRMARHGDREHRAYALAIVAAASQPRAHVDDLVTELEHAPEVARS